MEQKRFQDDGTHISQFLDVVSVICPKYQKQAKVLSEGTGYWHQKSHTLICLHCSFKQIHDRSHMAIGGAFDPFFKLPLWFTTTVRGNFLWAYNRQHLVFIKQLVQADLREKPFGHNYVLANRFPKWILAKKNRSHVIKAIDRLLKSTNND